MYLKFPKHISLQNQANFFLNILAQVFKFTILWNQRQRVYIILIAAVYFSRRMTDECQDKTYFMSIINITNPVIITRKKSDQSKTCCGQLQKLLKDYQFANLPRPPHLDKAFAEAQTKTYEKTTTCWVLADTVFFSKRCRTFQMKEELYLSIKTQLCL